MSDSDDSAESPFVRCPSCGGVHVRGGAHRCSEGARPVRTQADRERLSDLDDRPGDETVLVSPSGGDSAYHRAVGGVRDGEATLVPACGQQLGRTIDENGNPRTWLRRTRESCRDHSGRFPCRQCHGIDLGDD